MITDLEKVKLLIGEENYNLLLNMGFSQLKSMLLKKRSYLYGVVSRPFRNCKIKIYARSIDQESKTRLPLKMKYSHLIIQITACKSYGTLATPSDGG